MKKNFMIFAVIILCVLLIGCSSKNNKSINNNENNNIYSMLDKNNYKIFYQISSNGNYYDLDGYIYNSSYEKSDSIREFLDDDIFTTIDIVNMSNNKKKEKFNYTPDNYILDEKYVYINSYDEIDYYIRWNDNLDKLYVDFYANGNQCKYYINGSNSYEQCTKENIELAKKIYNNYSDVLAGLNLDEQKITSVLNSINNDYVQPYKEKLKSNYKKMSYNEFVDRIDESNYYIEKESNSLKIFEKNPLDDLSSMFNAEITFKNNKVKLFSLEYLEHIYIVFDNINKEYSLESKNSSCSYNIKKAKYEGNCSTSEKELLSQYSNSYKVLFSQFLSTYRTPLEEFISLIEEYYTYD